MLLIWDLNCWLFALNTSFSKNLYVLYLGGSVNLRVRLVLVGVEGEINLGLAIRTAKNFGVEEVFLVSPKVRIDDEEVIRFSSHARDLLGRVSIVDSLNEALENVE
ncbi:MAG TPA: hypothetical protein EYP08_02470 [Pyrodictiaceae archaeon]|nr:hypothetical protein [Pyrodictiaceae archaeon]